MNDIKPEPNLPEPNLLEKTIKGDNPPKGLIVHTNHKQKSIAHTSSSKLKTYGFIIAIIVGIVGIGLGGAGVAGHFHVGALSNLAQINAITMMAVGGGGGISFLILGIVGTVKNRKKEIVLHKSINEPNVDEIKDPKKAFIERTSKGVIRNKQKFGATEWNRYFGKIDEEPPLPKNIEDILDSPCPFSGDKNVKVRDTHMLVLIPATVNGKHLTLDYLETLIAKPKQGNSTNYRWYGKTEKMAFVKNQYGAVRVSKSHWVLMTRDILPGSGNKPFKEMEQILENQPDYAIPGVLEAATCILMEFVISGECLFNQNPTTYTMCKEEVVTQENIPNRGIEEKRNAVKVGGFAKHSGLTIINSYALNEVITGLAPIRVFND